MKPARIIVLVIALAAGGIAAFLASRPDHEPQAPQPVAQLETVDVLVANNDIGVGTALSSGDMRWQPWPTVAAGADFVRRSDRADAIGAFTGSIKTATLELTPSQAETFTRAKQMGNVTLALRSIADFEGKAAPEVDDKSQSRRGVNMVRFGVTLPATTPK